MKLLDRLKRKPKQTTFVYCPVCSVEQIANDCFVSDGEFVEYHCCLCGTDTRWNFDAPVPLLLFVRYDARLDWELAR